MPVRAVYVIAWVCALGAIVSFAANTSAAPDGDKHATIKIVGQPPGAAKLPEVIEELLGRLAVRSELVRATELDLREVVTPRPAPASLVASAWIDLRGTAS